VGRGGEKIWWHVDVRGWLSVDGITLLRHIEGHVGGRGVAAVVSGWTTMGSPRAST
jgi:hypothetical protein